MSRMYDNKALSNLPVHNVTWNGIWDHDHWTKHKQCKLESDDAGILCEGHLLGKARISVSSSQDSAAVKSRYYLLFTGVEKAHKRKFDAAGKELEPNFSETTKVSTGYLNSSYDVKAKGSTDRLSAEDVKCLLQNSPVYVLVKDLAKDSAGAVTFFMKEEDHDKIELLTGSKIRVKTIGRTPFIENIVVQDESTSSKSNFAGDSKMGGNWTDKIMAVKSASGDQDGQGASEIADDEWDD